MNPNLKVTFVNYGFKSKTVSNLNPEELDISYCFDISERIIIDQSRDGLSGINIITALPQTFYKQSHELLVNLVDTHNESAYCELRIYERHPINCLEYSLIGEYILDFNTIDISRDYTNISFFENNLELYINKNYSTKYDLKLDGETLPRFIFDYYHLITEQERGWNILSNMLVSVTQSDSYPISGCLIPNMTLITNKNSLYQSSSFPKSVEASYTTLGSLNGINGNNDLFFFRNISNETQTVKVHIDMNVTYTVDSRAIGNQNTPNVTISRLQAELLKFVQATEETYIPGTEELITDFSGTITGPSYHPIFTSNPTDILVDKDVTLGPGEFLVLAFIARADESSTTASSFTLGASLDINEFTSAKVTFYANNSSTGNEYEETQFLEPEDLLNALLRKLTNEDLAFDASIDWLDEDIKYFAGSGRASRFGIVPAEAIRGYEVPVIHTSLKEFSDWLYTLGYVITYPDKNSIKWVNWETLFQDDVTHDITRHEVNNLVESINQNANYTNVQFGYNVPDYSVDSGRYEVNGLFQYETQQLRHEESMLQIISPYRADNMGIEILSWERPETGFHATDNKSDNDVFVVDLIQYNRPSPPPGPIIFAIKLDENNYYTIPGTPVVIYNAKLSPYFLALRFQRFVSAFTTSLIFASTDLYRGAKMHIDGIENSGLYQNIWSLFERFKNRQVEFECIYIKSLYEEQNRYGIVRLEYNGKIYQGYIKNTTREFSVENTSTVTLFLKSKS